MSIDLFSVRHLLQRVQFPGYTFHVHADERGLPRYLQATFVAPCSVSGQSESQHTRKWLLSPHMTPSEVVQTAFKCVLTSVEHEAREQFKYRGQAIFGPHFDVDSLFELAQAEQFDTRPDPVGAS